MCDVLEITAFLSEIALNHTAARDVEQPEEEESFLDGHVKIARLCGVPQLALDR